tara:strand:+ start:10660 stop:11247 length:588 start_codon:yes stop_codon:yes gene_type:complete
MRPKLRKYKDLYSSKGIRAMVQNEFVRHKSDPRDLKIVKSPNGERRKVPEDFSPDKMWMRKPIRKKIVSEINHSLYVGFGELSKALPSIIESKNPKQALVDWLQKHKTSDLKTAEEEAAKIVEVLSKRNERMFKAIGGLRTRIATKTKKHLDNKTRPNLAERRAMLYDSNAADAFGHLFVSPYNKILMLSSKFKK